MNYFITAIDTDSGKTLVSAILCEAIGYAYWKPVQAGLPTDSETIRNLTENTVIYPETYLLNTPASPHAAAKIEGIEIDLNTFQLPATSKLIIEGAGGCLVPLNDKDFVIDLVPRLNAQVILVADLYLGSINHTLLSIQFLKTRQHTIKGIVFNGKSNPESERIILHHTSLPRLFHIHPEKQIDKVTVKRYAEHVRKNWHE